MSRHQSDAHSPKPFHPASVGERKITGRMVLLGLIAFFGVVFGINGLLIQKAVSTFGGVETDSAYQAGQAFERELARAKAQEARRWQVDAKVTPAGDGNTVLDIVARNAGAPIPAGMDTAVTLERPIDRRLDRPVAVSEISPGHFQGSAAIAAGQWDLVIEISQGGERQFRSKNRIMLR